MDGDQERGGRARAVRGLALPVRRRVRPRCPPRRRPRLARRRRPPRRPPPLDPRPLRPAWLGGGDVAPEGPPRAKCGGACGGGPVAAPPGRVPPHGAPGRDQLLSLRVRRPPPIEAPPAVGAGAPAEEARR